VSCCEEKGRGSSVVVRGNGIAVTGTSRVIIDIAFD
jgi:hypothetical protein